jgi:predicted ester cyclase
VLMMRARRARRSQKRPSRVDPLVSASAIVLAILRSAFTNLRLVREQIIADGNFLAARTTFSGDFTGLFTYSPIGPVDPTGQHLEWEVIGTFRYRDDGRLAEEWVQTDYRSLLTKLGVTTTESTERSRS